MVKFTIEEKINAITRYLNGADGYSTIAKDIGVHYSKLQFWVKKYQYHGKKAFLKNYYKLSGPI
ncbi:transposase [Viridibacillus sp. NPDC096237]|uniref:transposase n=1 Tax=Viridibacillus sp. NPDC096237 TaxID=3390721 RepID=UPI003D029FAF